MGDTESNNAEKLSCLGRVKNALTGSNGALFIAFTMSKWGDWMWFFASGLLLVYMDNGLRLTAILGFSSGGAMLVFGGLIGSWVDRSSRITAVRVTLIIQNISVAVCAVVVCAVLKYGVELEDYLKDYYIPLRDATIITFAVIGNLASAGYSIAITRDWIVVLADGNKSKLANLNAATRTIHLCCQILAPTFVGFIMTTASMFIASLTIAIWNVLSVAIEYALLTRVCNLVPALGNKKGTSDEKSLEQNGDASKEKGLEAVELVVEKKQLEANEDKEADTKDALLENGASTANGQTANATEEKTEKKKGKCACCGFLARIFTGWVIYFRQPVVFAGCALALLYVTVMGFDSVTTGYIYKNGVSEAVVGICSAIGGLAGILGTFIFTRSRKRIGLERTGLIAYQLEVACLILAVVSVWAPGSQFDPFLTKESTTLSNCTSMGDAVVYNGTVGRNITAGFSLDTNVTTLAPGCEEEEAGWNISVILFLMGIISSRVGLWMADLVVTQILQENVKESERGVVGGVQDSLNMLMDMIKFAIIISKPEIHFFGIHILWSFASIFIAACLFAYHSWRVRGHLFHFDRVCQYLCPGKEVPVPTDPIEENLSGSHYAISPVVHA